jgi:hypothetical protein
VQADEDRKSKTYHFDRHTPQYREQFEASSLAMLGVPLKDWEIYCEPAHAGVYTPPDSPDRARVTEMGMRS